MPATISHALSMTTPDDPLYENRPSHWNATHALTLAATGSEIIGAFSNANGLSFGLSGAAITASHNALTTAMASNRGSDFVAASAAFAGTSASGTIASNGISVSIGPYITTAMLSNAVTLSNIRVSGGTTSNLLSAITFGDANGVSFGLNAGTMTASHNALTSQSNQALSAANGSFTFQTATFANSNGVSFSTGTQGLYATVKTDYLTTAALSNHSHGISFTSGSVAFQTLSFTNSNGISFNSGTQGIFASHNALTTAAASDHSHGNPTLALTNINGTTASNSAGLTLSLSAAGGGTTNQTGPNIAAGTQTATSGTVVFANANQITFGMSDSSVVTASFNPINIGMSTGGNTAGTTGTFDGAGLQYILAGGPGVTLSQSSNASSVTLSINGGMHSQRFEWPPGNLTAVAAMGNGSFSINRMQNDVPVSATRVDVPFLVSLASSAAANTWGFACTAFGAIYTKNVSTLSSLSSGSTSFSFSLASNTAGQTQVIAHAIRPLSIPMNVNMSVGEYYVGFGVSTNTSSAGTATTALGNTWSIMGGPIYSSAVGQVGDFTATTNTSTGLFGGQGVYSAAISTVPPTVSLSAINQTGSYYARANMGLIFRNI